MNHLMTKTRTHCVASIFEGKIIPETTKPNKKIRRLPNWMTIVHFRKRKLFQALKTPLGMNESYR